MVINLNQGVSNKPLTNSTSYYRNNKIGFSGAGSAVAAVEKKVAEGGFWKKLADSIPEWSFAGNFPKKITETAEKNAALLEAGVAFALATTLRPSTIMVVPGAPKEDRKYASAKSIATGIVGFAFTAAVFIPIALATGRLGKMAQEGILKNGFPAKKDSIKYKVVEYFTTYVPKFVVAPLEAMALFAIVPPIVHKFLDKKPKQATAPVSLQPKNPVNPGSKG